MSEPLHLPNLPREILTLIAEALSTSDLESLMRVCKVFRLLCSKVWTRVDRKEHGYSSTIGHAIWIAWKTPISKHRERALEVITREIKNGARIDEDIPPARCLLFLRHQVPVPIEQDVEGYGLGVYSRARNLFFIVRCTRDEEIIGATSGATISIETVCICVLTVLTSQSVLGERVTVGGQNMKAGLQAISWTRPQEDLESNECEQWDADLEGVINHEHWTTGCFEDLREKKLAVPNIFDTDRVLAWIVQQVLVTLTAQGVQLIPSIEGRAPGSAQRPDIPLTDVSILYCEFCGLAYVIGWYDWIVENGELTSGTRPQRFSVEYMTCSSCEGLGAGLGAGEVDQRILAELVEPWLGDLDCPYGETTVADIKGSAPFSWCKRHFQFFSLRSEEGLKPVEAEVAFDNSCLYLAQWYREGGKVTKIDVGTPRLKELKENMQWWR